MQRLRICAGVAHALCYLHFGLMDNYSVIHGNIKSSKILLDHNWEPKLHDFRCSVKVKRGQPYLTDRYNGTLQYKDPAFESTGGLTHKSDVFSFGVLLFEVLFGTKASVQQGDNWYFAKMARLCYDEKRLDDMIDRNIRKQMDTQSLKLFTKTAYLCLKEQRSQRPDMKQIVKKLNSLEIHQSFVRPTATVAGALSNPFKRDHGDSRIERICKSENEFRIGASPIVIENRKKKAVKNFRKVVHGKKKKPFDKHVCLHCNRPDAQFENLEETKGFKEVQKIDLNTEKVKKQHMEEQEMILSAKKVVYTSSDMMNPDRFDGRISQLHQVYHDSIISSGAIEFLRHPVFCIRFKIQRQMLSANTKNVCYVVFKLSEKCHGLHGPVIVRDLFHQKETRILYFRSPNPSNIHDSDWIPEKREDGWLEVIIWIFNSDYELKSDHLFVNLKLVTYEGTMSGLIVRGIEFRPI
ncbi:hypothetical protein E3N88_14347 [Mikania micrantha]|uniref:Protein kinase domain-containing protein n=1 Tax=Mikania micrantha TaxID=192012 RepID=A0A5N6P2H3_9ASTR|nr:hypothetical protein E3N88_14347 [Mikania micrantha]